MRHALEEERERREAEVGKRVPFFAMPFYTKNDRFTKTGSGQT